MPSRLQRLNLVRNLRPNLRRAALLATLPHAAPDEREDIIRTLVPRSGADDAADVFPAIARHWTLVPASTRDDLVVAARDAVRPAIENLARNADPVLRTCALSIANVALAHAHLFQNDDLAAMLDAIDLLDDEDPRVAETAARTLRNIAVQPETPARAGDALDRRLARAAAHWHEHRRDAVILAVLARAHRAGPQLQAWLDDDDQPGALALRGAARKTDLDTRRRRAILWLAVRPLAGVGLECLTRCLERGDVTPITRHAHLLDARGRDRALQGLRRAERLLPGDDALESLTADARLGLLRLVERLPMNDEARLHALRRFTADRAPAVRLRAVRALGDRRKSRRAADVAIAPLAADADPRVAAAATLTLFDSDTDARRTAMAPALARLRTSPHARVRRIAELARAADIDDALTPPDNRWGCPVAARRALHENRDDFLRRLREAARAGETHTRLHAFTLIERFRLWHECAAEVLRAVRDAEPRVASKAVLLLARLPGGDIDALIDALLDHQDPRVHANAVEARLERTPPIDWMVRMRHDNVARARANVVRHIVRATNLASCGRDVLAEMLDDNRPDHRLSALWVAERTRCDAVTDRIARIARHDDHPLILTRAERCLRRLDAPRAHEETAA